MPTYFAGCVSATAAIKWGGGFRVERIDAVGTYRISLPAPGLFHVTTVTPTALNAIARIVLARRDALTGGFWIDIEIRDAVTRLPVDSEFNFIALLRSS
jgi:hypothetical protein